MTITEPAPGASPNPGAPPATPTTPTARPSIAQLLRHPLWAFITRRVIVGILVLWVATFVMYILVANAGDPLAKFAEDSSPNKAEKVAAIRAALHLDQPVVLRYFTWLGGASRCLIGHCDLGQTINNTPVASSIVPAMASTFRLVVIALIIAIVLGAVVGILSALRQYSTFDYSVTFLSFVLYSLPIFWVAVLLKEFGAIKFNDWLAHPRISLLTTIVFATIIGLIFVAVMGGNRVRKLITFIATASIVIVALQWISAVEWLRRPALGPYLLCIYTLAAALLFTALLTGLKNRRVLSASLITVLLTMISYFALAPWLNRPTYGFLVCLALTTIIISGLVGYYVGGARYRGPAIRVSVLTGLVGGLLIILDQLLRHWHAYIADSNGRPIPTSGASTPNFRGTVWMQILDIGAHQILPTIALVLISFAAYTRYTRASMLEVMNQDYIRTARAKGLSEREVIVRHAFRNTLIPLVTIVAFDFGQVLGGAVITENVFGWRGMGTYFIKGLLDVDPNPVMAFFLITASATVIFNIIADVLYAFLDPRIRLS